MKKGFLFLLILLLCLSILPTKILAAPGVSAENAVLMEFESGRVLYEKNAHQQKSIASITKILTAIVAIENGNLNDVVTVSDRAVRTEGSSIYLKPGDKVKLKDLIYGLMLRSGNDSAVAIAEHVGGSVEGFAHLMNEKARWIGMQNSHFANPHGLEQDGHYSTAYDMALLMRYAMHNQTFAKISGTVSYQSETYKYPWRNKNKLLTQYYKYCIGGKTGFTRKAGRTLVTSAEKEGMKLIAVTLNASGDWNDHTNLYEWGYKSYELELIKNEGDILIPLPNGNTMSGEIVNPVRIPLTKSEVDQLEHITYVKKDLNPVEDELVGKQVYKLDGEVLAVRNIIHEPTPKQNEGFLNKVKQIFNQISGVL
ncbi:D-alanyl-D-alanine carboxypeptidase family protein [Salirhabdus sp. Marseille-P4669]|uniref:D-alanyl-D-alanine carboxypeptidase family protein n=1 Tax=Salirhabdus sp. Marseille-P4669 TaxID=2042310 RepID=UPI000C7D51C3|nr:D-alanyl-D-alanine carboxypeptidase family protein [Salirhabdus sp. Marseille-P4669]